tara:strand:- start:1053 stop:2678 length:1626 start_codon:yes stop_codon:yes gene_type:complete
MKTFTSYKSYFFTWLVCFLIFSSKFFAQQSVTINGPTTVEVGVPNNYTFTFNPDYPYNISGTVQADSYVITEWIVLTGTNGLSNAIPGYINSTNNQSSYYYDGTYNNSNPKTIPIQWGDGSYISDDNITVKVSGIYIKSSTGAHIGYFDFLTKTKPVTVERLIVPNIDGPSTVTGCDQTNQIYTISNDTNSNQRVWTTTGGASIVGSNTSTSVTIKPPLSGDFNVICTVKRSGANSNYSKSSSKTITRTIFNTSAFITGNETICNTSNYSVSGLEPGLSVLSWSSNISSVATVSNTNGNTASLTKVSRGNVVLTATLINSCNETRTITKNIIVGSPMPTMNGFYCVTESAPCYLDADANNNYLTFTLSAPIGSYVPQDSDWQWEKVSGNFYFLENGQYNSNTHSGKQGNIYLTGPNPTDNALQFKCRVKNACDWGPWRYFVWNDGTTTPPVPPTPPAKYFVISPNPTGSYYAHITLKDPNVIPTTTNPIIAKLYSIYGQLLSTTQLSNSGGDVGHYGFSYNTMYITITFDSHSESHTIVKF